MYTEEEDEDARKKTLQDLMQSMGQMDAKRLPGLTIAIGAAPAAAPKTEGPGEDFGIGGKEEGDEFRGMDPRLVEIVKKKKAGMGY